MTHPPSAYDRVAPWYDALAAGYGSGAMGTAKKAAAHFVPDEASVLIVGAGTASEAPLLATRAARLTLLDAAPRMLARARRRLANAENVEFVAGPLENFAPQTPFDVVIAPFFLNVYERATLPSVVRRLAELMTPTGRLVIVDFAAPRSGWFGVLQRAYYLPPLALFRWLTKNPWHELYDYEALLGSESLRLARTGRIPSSMFGLPLFETLCFERRLAQ